MLNQFYIPRINTISVIIYSPLHIAGFDLLKFYLGGTLLHHFLVVCLSGNSVRIILAS